MTKGNTSAKSKAVSYQGRCAFGLYWFATEEDANAFAEEVKAEGRTYNGGWYDGRPCGREPHFDYVKDGQKLYAVSI